MKRMFIILEKIRKRILSYCKVFIWKVFYGKSFKKGHNTFFYPLSHILIDKDGMILIGNNCFFNRNCSINSMGKIKIGDDCIFGENVCLYDHNHKYKLNKNIIRKQGYDVGTIEIGNNCWIGSNVIILNNVKIGDNVVIAAGTIVNKSIENNSVVIDKKNLVISRYDREKEKNE